MDYQDDTNPTGTSPQVYAGPNNRRKGSLRWVGLAMLAAAFVLVGVLALLILGGDSDDEDEPTETTPIAGVPLADPTDPTEAPTDDPEPTVTLEDDVLPPTQPLPDDAGDGLVALDPQTATTLLSAPVVQAEPQSPDLAQVRRDLLDPFTIIPARERNEIITYVAVQGDTISAIAERFGLEPETIAWSNSRRKIQALRPGDELTIPPTDGVLVTTIGSTRTVADWVQQYEVDDPYVALDAGYNTDLRGLGPDDIPPSGTRMFIPGGIGDEVVWQADIQVSGGDSSGGDSGGQPDVLRVTFQNGQPGSCPAQVAGGASFWSNPMTPGTYRITRGYASYHQGIDLAAPVGTTVRAANGGRVVFSGWNSFGYGYMIAVVHGPTMTVYAHLSSYYTNCGDIVTSGQPIGEVGSTGNSSGPHLHFEIRVLQGNTYVPTNPASTMGF
jgi:murein DD-endopeptidase MepM/ murein hydrolase activator NlpD